MDNWGLELMLKRRIQYPGLLAKDIVISDISIFSFLIRDLLFELSKCKIIFVGEYFSPQYRIFLCKFEFSQVLIWISDIE